MPLILRASGLLSFCAKKGLDTCTPWVYLRSVMAEQSTTEYLSARIPPQVMEQVSGLAERERRSISQMTLILLEEALKARSKAVKNGK